MMMQTAGHSQGGSRLFSIWPSQREPALICQQNAVASFSDGVIFSKSDRLAGLLDPFICVFVV